MKLYTIERPDGKSFVCGSEDGKTGYLLKRYMTMNVLLLKGFNGSIPGLSEEVDMEEMKLHAPIPHPRQDVLCIGLNYSDHVREAREFLKDKPAERPENPTFFSKRALNVMGDRAEISLHSDFTEKVDYEAELGVIIGKDAYNVKAEDAEEYVFGYTIINDISARDIQNGYGQWHLGKSLDGFTAMGPCIVTRDEFSFPPKLPIRCRVNGELRQESNTGKLLFGIPEIIERLTKGMTLAAGTIIATGTPAGVGAKMNPPSFLKPGDVVECEIEGIGTLTNTFTA